MIATNRSNNIFAIILIHVSVSKLMSVPKAFNKKHGTFQYELHERLKDGVFR